MHDCPNNSQLSQLKLANRNFPSTGSDTSYKPRNLRDHPLASSPSTPIPKWPPLAAISSYNLVIPKITPFHNGAVEAASVQSIKIYRTHRAPRALVLPRWEDIDLQPRERIRANGEASNRRRPRGKKRKTTGTRRNSPGNGGGGCVWFGWVASRL